VDCLCKKTLDCLTRDQSASSGRHGYLAGGRERPKMPKAKAGKLHGFGESHGDAGQA